MVSDKLFNLPITKQYGKKLSEVVYNDIPLLIIRHHHFNAIISLQGAQLLHWQLKEHPPIIWLSEQATFSLGSAIRGGVPVCWPWFGKVKNPSHGFARNMLWKLTQLQEIENNIVINLQLKDTQQTRQLWPNSFVIDLQFTIGQQCHIELDIKGYFDCTAALHSYFYVSDITQVSVLGLGQQYFDNLSQQVIQQPHPDRAIHITDTTDRIYTQPQIISTIIDPLLSRKITVEHHYASDVVLWNPWRDGAAKLDDMDSQGFNNMLCIETARIQRPLVAIPKVSAKLGCVISTSKI